MHWLIQASLLFVLNLTLWLALMLRYDLVRRPTRYECGRYSPRRGRRLRLAVAPLIAAAGFCCTAVGYGIGMSLFP